MSFITRRLRNSFGPGVPAPSKGLAAEWVRFWTELGRDLVRRPCDEATDLFLQAVAGVLSLDPLAPHLTAKTDLVVQVDDVLHAVPLAYLPLKGRRLLERVASVRSVLSPLVSALQRREQQEAGQTLDGLDRRLMVISSFAEDDGAASGAVFLHRQMEELGRRVGYECLQAFDDPPGTLRGLAAGLRDGGQPRRVAALVTCGHGDASRAGVRLADVLQTGGHCDLSPADFIVQVSCSVGRNRQGGWKDVEGFCVELTAHRARSILAGKWQLHSLEAPRFAVRVVEEYLKERELGGRNPRARAVAQAARHFLEAAPGEVGLNTLAAFELYGLG